MALKEIFSGKGKSIEKSLIDNGFVETSDKYSMGLVHKRLLRFNGGCMTVFKNQENIYGCAFKHVRSSAWGFYTHSLVLSKEIGLKDIYLIALSLDFYQQYSQSKRANDLDLKIVRDEQPYILAEEADIALPIWVFDAYHASTSFEISQGSVSVVYNYEYGLEKSLRQFAEISNYIEEYENNSET